MNDTPCVELEEKDKSSVTLSDVEFTEPRHSQVSSIMKQRKRSIQLDVSLPSLFTRRHAIVICLF